MKQCIFSVTDTEVCVIRFDGREKGVRNQSEPYIIIIIIRTPSPRRSHAIRGNKMNESFKKYTHGKVLRTRDIKMIGTYLGMKRDMIKN